jgi:hypothetical protein
MWRREERLKFWLEGSGQTQKPSSKLGLKEKVLVKLQLRQSARAVKGESLDISADAKSLDSDLDISAQVKEALGAFGSQPILTGEFSYDFPDSGGFVRDVELYKSCRVRNLDLPDQGHAQIRQEKMEIAPIVRLMPISIRAAEIIMLESLFSQMPEVKDGKRILVSYPSIQNLTSQISELPHARASIKLDQLQDTERSSFLREAEILKGIPIDRVEILAIFRHVPIELISRLRLLADQTAILYSISRETKSTQTRVHDMAAIRDIGSQEVHLIPHRTQYRSVSLG